MDAVAILLVGRALVATVSQVFRNQLLNHVTVPEINRLTTSPQWGGSPANRRNSGDFDWCFVRRGLQRNLNRPCMNYFGTSLAMGS
jgi:hypothetical protein